MGGPTSPPSPSPEVRNRPVWPRLCRSGPGQARAASRPLGPWTGSAPPRLGRSGPGQARAVPCQVRLSCLPGRILCLRHGRQAGRPPPSRQACSEVISVTGHASPAGPVSSPWPGPTARRSSMGPAGVETRALLSPRRRSPRSTIGVGAEMTPGTSPVLVEGLMSGPTTQSAVRPRPQRGSPSSCSGPSAPPPYAPVGQRGDWRGFPEGDPAGPRPARGSYIGPLGPVRRAAAPRRSLAGTKNSGLSCFPPRSAGRREGRPALATGPPREKWGGARGWPSVCPSLEVSRLGTQAWGFRKFLGFLPFI